MTQRSIPIGVVVNPEVSAYIERSTQWPEQLAALREILLRCGLSEEIKWGKPCYSHDGSNVAILQEMKRFLALMFFKGALLQDPEGVLEEQGPNSRSARRITFSSLDDVARRAAAIEAFVAEAIAVADAGLTVGPAPELALVDELQRRIERDPAFKAAFEALTPGRQRELNLYVAGAKQSTTREARVEKHAQRILEGKGLRDR
jgi:uncharacterized protein YdeI (YjbR/CyaY-like superfamily)